MKQCRDWKQITASDRGHCFGKDYGYIFFLKTRKLENKRYLTFAGHLDPLLLQFSAGYGHLSSYIYIWMYIWIEYLYTVLHIFAYINPYISFGWEENYSYSHSNPILSGLQSCTGVFLYPLGALFWNPPKVSNHRCRWHSPGSPEAGGQKQQWTYYTCALWRASVIFLSTVHGAKSLQGLVLGKSHRRTISSCKNLSYSEIYRHSSSHLTAE